MMRRGRAVFCAASLAAVAFLAVRSPGQAAPLSDEASFTEFVAAGFRVAMPDSTVTVRGPLQLKLELPGDREAQRGTELGIGRLWDFCRGNHDRCDQALSVYVGNSKQALLEERSPITLAMLRAVLRHRNYVENTRRALLARGGSDDRMPLARPFVADLVEMCVVDRPTSAAPVSVAMLREVGLSEAEARTICRDNLRASMPPPAEVAGEIPSNAFKQLDAGYYYESGRLIAHQDWEPVARALGGNLIAVAPSYELVIFGRGDSEAAVGALEALAIEAGRRSQVPLSGTVLRWTPDGWVPAPRR